MIWLQNPPNLANEGEHGTRDGTRWSFLQSGNPEKLYEWYEKHPGIKQDVLGQGVSFRWKEDGDPDGFTAWSIFKQDTKYFQPSTEPFMLNFRVEDLHGLLEKLRGEAGRTMTTGGLPGPWTRKETGSSCGNRRVARERIGSWGKN